MVALTRTGPMALGSAWRSMIYTGWMLMSRAAATYSLFFSSGWGS
jgi:hypothetical protein